MKKQSKQKQTIEDMKQKFRNDFNSIVKDNKNAPAIDQLKLAYINAYSAGWVAAWHEASCPPTIKEIRLQQKFIAEAIEGI